MRHPDSRQLLRIGIADAYAAGAEYLKFPRDDQVRKACLEFKRYVGHPTHGHIPGTYTDDTEMSVANARVLVECEPPYTATMFADAYVREFARGNRRKGYSRGFQSFLESIRSGAEFLAQIRPDSRKNGAAMRATPFGVLPDVQQVLDAATLQARITHDTPEGRFSARAVALMSHFALRERESLREMPDYCLGKLPKEDVRQFGYVFGQKWPGKPVTSLPHASVGVTTVHAVVDLLVGESAATNSLMTMLERLIRWGGDTDSVAAVAWGIASPRFPNEPLPEFMERDLEQGSAHTGAAYLRDIGEKLMAKFV